MEGLTVGQLARQAGVNQETVRYYERRALVTPSSRTAAGYRQYPPSAVRRIAFIKRAQTLGFTLDEVAHLLALEADASQRCADVAREASIAVKRIDQKLAELTRMRATLGKLVEACRAKRETSACPLLEALVSEGGPAGRAPNPGPSTTSKAGAGAEAPNVLLPPTATEAP